MQPRWTYRPLVRTRTVFCAILFQTENKRVYYRGARFIGGRDEYLPIPNAQYNFSEGTYVQNPGYGKFN